MNIEGHHDNDIECHGMIFIRLDVYERLLDETPDRGKSKRIGIDWDSPDLLRELLRRRIVASGGSRTRRCGQPLLGRRSAPVCPQHRAVSSG
jgi:hypothetical protein